MGHLVDFDTLPLRDAGDGVARAAIAAAGAKFMAAEVVRLAAGATLAGEVPPGSDLYLYALQGSARLQARGTQAALGEDAFATVQEGSAYTLSNPGNGAVTIVYVLAPPQGSGAALAGFRGGLSVITRAEAPVADVPEQKKRRRYFVDKTAAQSERAHAMIVEYQADTVTVMHSHPNADSMFVPLTGKVRFTFDGRDHVVERGQATLFPAGDRHGLCVAEGKVSFLEFHVPAAYTTLK